MCYLVNLRRHIDRMCESECKCVSVYVRDLQPPHIVLLSFAQCLLGQTPATLGSGSKWVKKIDRQKRVRADCHKAAFVER